MTPFDGPRRESALLRSIRAEGARLIRRHTAAGRSKDYAAAETLVRRGLASWDDGSTTDYGYRRLRPVEEVKS